MQRPCAAGHEAPETRITTGDELLVAEPAAVLAEAHPVLGQMLSNEAQYRQFLFDQLLFAGVAHVAETGGDGMLPVPVLPRPATIAIDVGAKTPRSLPRVG